MSTKLNTLQLSASVQAMQNKGCSREEIAKKLCKRYKANDRYVRDAVNAVFLAQELEESNYAKDVKNWQEEALKLYRERRESKSVIATYIANKYFPSSEGKSRKNQRDKVVKYLNKADTKAAAKDSTANAGSSAPKTQSESAFRAETTVKANGEIEHEKRIAIPPDKVKETEEMLSDEASLLEYHGFSDLFTVTSAHHSIWESPVRGGGTQTLCSSKITVKKRGCSPEELTKGFDELLARREPPVVQVKKSDGENIAILSIADLHLGKLAWGVETGENYDHKIAAARYNYIVDAAVSLLKDMNVERIIFFWSQDFFQYDTVDVTTTAGTRQDSDVRWAKLFNLGCKLLIEGIEKLASIAPVSTFYTRSNHDEQSSYYATSVLWAYFRNTPDITVDRSPLSRKYVQYGVNLFGFGHGDKEGKRIEGLMQVEAPKEWGDTWFREFFLGHFHSLRQYEANGIVFRYLQSPTGTDAWHAQSGYIGAGKCAQLFVRNKKTGPVLQSEIYIPKGLTE